MKKVKKIGFEAARNTFGSSMSGRKGEEPSRINYATSDGDLFSQ